MRLLHLVFAIGLIAVVMAVCQEPAGRVAIVVFCTAIGELVIGTTAVMALFQTVGAIGEAKGLYAHAEAVLATTVILGVATAIMSGWLFVGVWLVRAAVE